MSSSSPPPETTEDDEDEIREMPIIHRGSRHLQRRGEEEVSLAGIKLVFFSASRLYDRHDRHRENVVQCLDLAEGVWLPPKTLPFDVHAGAALCQHGRHIYLVGGITVTGRDGTLGAISSQFVRYDLQRNDGQRCNTQGLQPRTRSASFAAADGRVYVLGGSGAAADGAGSAGGTSGADAKPLDSVQCYENDNWHTLRPLLFAMAAPTASVFDGKCYVVGVSDAPKPAVRLQVNVFESDDRWTEVCLHATIPPRLHSVTALVDRDGVVQVRYFRPVARPGFYLQQWLTYEAAHGWWSTTTRMKWSRWERIVCVSPEGGGAGGGVSTMAFAELGRLPRSATVWSTGAAVRVDLKLDDGAVCAVPYYEEEQCPSLYTFGLQC